MLVAYPPWFDRENGHFIEKYEFGNENELEVSVTFHTDGHKPVTKEVGSTMIEESMASSTRESDSPEEKSHPFVVWFVKYLECKYNEVQSSIKTVLI